jgi:alpha-galactosidase
LLTNDDVLEVSQDPLGRQAGLVSKEAGIEVWAKQMEDGSTAAGLFNRGDDEARVVVKWPELGLKGKLKVRDLWRQQDLGIFKDQFETSIPRHGVVLIRVGGK